MKKALVATAFVLLGLVIIAQTSVAANLVEDITAQINQNVIIMWDKEIFVATDASGNIIKPIIYNNTVYVPLRAFGVESGHAVAWDPDTSTVSVSSPEESPETVDTVSEIDTYTPRTLSLIKDFTPYQSDSSWVFGSVDVDDIRYDPCFYNDSFSTASAYWQLDQKFTTFTFKVASNDSVFSSQGLWLYGDDILLYNSPKIDAGHIIEYEVDLSDCNQLKIVIGPRTAIIAADIVKTAK